MTEDATPDFFFGFIILLANKRSLSVDTKRSYRGTTKDPMQKGNTKLVIFMCICNCHLQTCKKNIFVREPGFGFGNDWTI